MPSSIGRRQSYDVTWSTSTSWCEGLGGMKDSKGSSGFDLLGITCQVCQDRLPVFHMTKLNASFLWQQHAFSQIKRGCRVTFWIWHKSPGAGRRNLRRKIHLLNSSASTSDTHDQSHRTALADTRPELRRGKYLAPIPREESQAGTELLKPCSM